VDPRQRKRARGFVFDRVRRALAQQRSAKKEAPKGSSLAGLLISERLGTLREGKSYETFDYRTDAVSPEDMNFSIVLGGL
jgi:hypothetical protein